MSNSLVHNIDMLSPADVQIEKELYSDDEAELIKDYYKRKDIDLEDILKDIVDVYVYNTSELTPFLLANGTKRAAILRAVPHSGLSAAMFSVPLPALPLTAAAVSSRTNPFSPHSSKPRASRQPL